MKNYGENRLNQTPESKSESSQQIPLVKVEEKVEKKVEEKEEKKVEEKKEEKVESINTPWDRLADFKTAIDKVSTENLDQFK